METAYYRVLEQIAEQKLPDEMTEDEQDSADYEGAYEAIVKLARYILRK